MKLIILFTTLITFNTYANESIIQLLEKNGVSTEAFVTSESAKKYKGSELKSAIEGLVIRLALTQYATVDHKSESGMCLEQGIVEMFKKPEEFEPTTFYHCGGIFDEESFDSGDEDINHQKQHQMYVTLVKQLAFDDCNQDGHVAQIPVFTAPQELVNIIYNLSSHHHMDYDLLDGASFHCIKQQMNILTPAGN